MRIIALINQKGGVGKTTSVINIGAGLALTGRRVLLVDMDPQSNLTYSLGMEPDDLPRSVYDVLTESADINDVVIRHSDNIDVLPSNLRLSAAEMTLQSVPGREKLLQESLSKLTQDYDYILIDAPPSLATLTMNVLTAAKEVFIPVQLQVLALQGVSSLMETIALVQKRLNPQLTVSGVIPTMYSARKNLNRDVLGQINEYFDGGQLFHTIIRDNVSLQEAPSYGLDIFTYKKDSHGAEDYHALTQEIIAKEPTIA